MDKEVVVQFDADAYKEYTELQNAVAEGKHSAKHPTHEQLLSSINTAIRNIKANPFYGDCQQRPTTIGLRSLRSLISMAVAE